MTDRIICYGDVIDDIVVTPRGPIRADTDTGSSIQMRPGGSAANTAAWLGEIGRPVDFIGVVGAGDAKRQAELLPQANAILREHARLQTGRIVVIVRGEQRDMLTDRGANVDLAPGDVTDAMLARARLLHFTGHVLLNSPGLGGVRTLIQRCQGAGVQVSVSAGSAGFIEEVGADRVTSAFAGAGVLFAGYQEGTLLTGESDPLRVARALGERYGVSVVTNGSKQVTVATGAVVQSFDVKLSHVVDPTGAGDAFSAGFLDSWLRGQEISVAVESGAQLASRAIGNLGGRP